MIQGCKNHLVRKKALQDKQSLSEIIKFAQGLEVSEAKSKFVEDVVHLEGASSSMRIKQEANSIQNRQNHKNYNVQSQNSFGQRQSNSSSSKHKFERQNHSKPSRTQETSGSGNICTKCGQVHRVRCPAEGKTCSKCQRVGHLAKVCRSTKVSNNNVPGHVRHIQKDLDQNCESKSSLDRLSESVVSDDSQHSWAICGSNLVESPRAKIRIGQTELTMCVDTGTTSTIIDESSFLKLVPKPNLQACKTPFYGFNANAPLEILGEFDTTLILGQKTSKSTVSVVRGNCGCLLSCIDSINLDIVKLDEKKLVLKVDSSNHLEAVQSDVLNRESIFAEFPEVFSDKIGKLIGFQAKLNIDPNVKPVRQKHRHVPHHIKGYVTEKINKMIDDGVLEHASGPMPWISPLLALPKPGQDGKAISDSSQIRLVADSQLIISAIIREHRVCPTPEDLAVKVNGCDLYSTMDLIESYSQIELAEDSIPITTVSSH